MTKRKKGTRESSSPTSDSGTTGLRPLTPDVPPEGSEQTRAEISLDASEPAEPVGKKARKRARKTDDVIDAAEALPDAAQPELAASPERDLSAFEGLDIETTVNLSGELLASVPLRDDLAPAEGASADKATEAPDEDLATTDDLEAGIAHSLEDDEGPPTGDRGWSPVALEPQAREEDERQALRGALEALVFASDAPIKTKDLAKLASAQVQPVTEALAELHQEYARRGIHLEEVAGGWVFRTSARYAPFVRDLTKQRPVRLSRAQVETLAIIAYRQPITRPEIDDVRGVDSGPVLKALLERDLVRILGKRDEPGRPLIYGTTTGFLEFFGLRSLKDLPTLREFTELTDESREAYEEEMGEAPNDAFPSRSDSDAPSGVTSDDDVLAEVDILGEEAPPFGGNVTPANEASPGEDDELEDEDDEDDDAGDKDDEREDEDA